MLLLILARPKAGWQPHYLGGAAMTLYQCLLKDKEPGLRLCAAHALDILLPVFLRPGQRFYLADGSLLHYSHLRDGIDAILETDGTQTAPAPYSKRLRLLVKELTFWAAGNELQHAHIET